MLRDGFAHSGLALPDQSLIKRMPPDMPSGQSDGGSSLAEVLSSWLTLFLRQVDQKLSTHHCSLGSGVGCREDRVDPDSLAMAVEAEGME